MDYEKQVWIFRVLSAVLVAIFGLALVCSLARVLIFIWG
jgi:hypothetical protein